MLFSLVFAGAGKARACSNCILVGAGHYVITFSVFLAHTGLRDDITDKFDDHRKTGEFFYDMVLRSIAAMTTQLTTTAMMQVTMIGAMLDAENQLETQLLFQELKARAHKDYTVSTEMCSIGTAAIGLAGAGAHAELTAHALAQRSFARQLHNANSVGAPGPDVDKAGRVELLIERYCDASDNNSETAAPGYGLQPLCGAPKPVGARAPLNRDVAGGRLFSVLTRDARYDNAALDADDPDFFALANNLYAHDIMPFIPEALLQGATPDAITPNQDILLDVRSIVAKRAVAEDSFNSIAAMRARGAGTMSTNAPYLATLLEMMGYARRDAEEMIGDAPSYQARMELLTKKMYMNPVFYTNLYDKPANVGRKGAALRAVGLMQDMDLYKSKLRNEMALSVLLELEVARLQEQVDIKLKSLRAGGGG